MVDFKKAIEERRTKRTLAIDIETYSPVDLKESGLYAYTEHPEFEILLFAYAFDKEPVKVIDLISFEDIPDDVFMALTDRDVLKTAHNANFERVCLGKHFGIFLPIDQWECTMVKSAMLGLPFALGMVGKVLKIDQEKMTEGKALIRYFSMPCKPTKANGMRTRNLPEHDMEKWNTYKLYNARDVEAEREIREKTAFFKMHDGERELYVLDQLINDRGVMVDMQFVNNAIAMDATYKDRLTVEMTELTNLNNPNSVSQLKAWIAEETGEDVTSLTKEAILIMLKNTPSDEVTRVLRNRQEMAKTSVKKYQAMANAVGTDGRIRGLLQFYGANRTGRWAGRLVQVQNLPQNHLFDLDLARELVRDNDLEMLEMLFGNVPDTLSQLIRTAFIAKPGHTFLVADFSAIEARVIAWLAGEKWRLDVFATHGKIYEASASQMFKVPIEEVTKGSPLRQKGKVSELALGYQGGPGALTQMGALKMGLQEEELQGLVDAWRAANPSIVRLWKTVDNAAKEAVENRALVAINHGIKFDCRAEVLFIELPSGRKLSYIHPRLGKNRFDSASLIYEGMNQTTKQWCDQETYGGKLVENIVQAIARDCLAYAMLNLDKAGYNIVMHVHDEAIIEIEEEKANLEDVCKIMGQPIPWAKGLLLRADGYSTNYYKKD
ncbi:MAG: DNA polymerase [Bacteroidetes bacterium]|nr:DNA polymerase [Bacteroidota bacterium]MCL6101002.1 DNA polymerase [Bacteroidota bacterium]